MFLRHSCPTLLTPLVAGAIATLAPALADAQAVTTRVSVGTGGIQSNHPSIGPAISADGRWAAFDSSASNLVPGDTNDTQDVFLHDRQTGATTRLSVGPGGGEGDGLSRSPAISADGRWVAFVSFATNLVAGDTNHVADVFAYDRQAGTLARVSVGPGGIQGDLDSDDPAITPDGRWVAFSSLATTLVADDLNAERDVFVHDRQTGITTRVSVGPGGTETDGGSGWPAISADGQMVAFTSMAANLVPDDTNDEIDTFVHDRQTGATTRVSVGPGGIEGDGMSWGAPSISADGQRIAFQSGAGNLVPDDTNGEHDVFVHDRQTGTTRRVSLGPGGLEGDSWSEFPAISADGRWVVFDSASPMVAGDSNGVSDVFVYDLQAGTMGRVSEGPGGVQGNYGSYQASISADGRWIAFVSDASSLVTGDTNGYADIFVRDVVATTPMPPGDLVVQAVDGNLVTLRWTSPGFGPAPTDFVIEGGTAPGEVLATCSIGSTAPTITVAAPAGSFYVRVRTVSGVYRSDPSNEVLAHVRVPLAPSAPAPLLALVNGSTVTLAWQNTFTGGAPESFVLDVAGTRTASIPLPFGDAVSFADAPEGRYTLALRAVNASGSSPASDAVMISVPGPCSGPPAAPTEVFAYSIDGTVRLSWAPGTSGPAPTAYVVIVTGAWTGTFVTTGRQAGGALGAGAYTLSLVAVNPCGASPATPPRIVSVP